METFMSALSGIAIVFICIYVGAKAFLVTFFPEVSFTIFHGMSLLVLYLSIIFLVTIGFEIIRSYSKINEEEEDKVEKSARQLLISAILSNGGFLNVQSQYYSGNIDGEYRLKTERLLDGVYQLKLEEINDGKKNSPL